MRLNKKINYSFIFVIASFLALNFAQAQGLDKSQLNDLIWEKIQNTSILNYQELSSKGNFLGCELVYSYPYRDYRTRNGEPVIVNGSITSSYTKGKAFSLFLKLQPRVFDMNSKPPKLVSIQPSHATLKIKDINLDKYQLTNFKCDEGGFCAAYGSSNQVKFMEDVFSVMPFNPSIYFNLSKNGVDEKFSLMSLKGNNKKSEVLLNDFTECLLKIVNVQIKDMEKK